MRSTIADYIAERDTLRAVVRGLLTPLVLVIKYPFGGAGVLMTMLLLGAGVRWRSHATADNNRSRA